MWVQGEDSEVAESDEESYLSSEDEEDIQIEILEKQRDEANQRLSELEEVSNQLLKEINVLEMQFQIERSCRESAEALAVKVNKENKVLKRKSQMLMPLITELPENLDADPFDLQTDPTVNTDVVDFGEDTSGDESLLLESQVKIAELQASVDGLLAEKLQLEQQVEDLTKEQDQLRQQLALEVEEKEALMWKMSKQNKTMTKIKCVSKLVTEEFTEMSQKLQLEEDLRQHAEVFAHQILVQQETHPRSVMQSPETVAQLQQALEQISNISTALSDIQRYYQEQVKPNQSAVEESSVLSELQNLREQLEKSEEERKAIETQLSEANSTVTQLQEEVKQLQETLNRDHTTDEAEEKSPPATPLPPPTPPPPPPPSTVINSLDFLRSRRKDSKGDTKKSAPSMDLKSKAVDEMMERIKNGIVLRPMKQIQESDSMWMDTRSENRKSAVLELKDMLNNMKRQQHRRVPSRRGIGRNVGDAELLMVLQRRRNVMGENQDQSPLTQTQDPQPGAQHVPVAGDVPWANEKGTAPVLRRLKQNREKRDSRIRASALIISQEN